jgi:hypothetical protein
MTAFGCWTPARSRALRLPIVTGGAADSGGAAAVPIGCAGGYAALVRRDERALRELRARIETSGRFWCSVPEQERDVHDLEALSRVGRVVAGAGSPIGGSDGTDRSEGRA